MEPALRSGDSRGKHLHSKFQQVHERINYLPDLKFGLLASPRGLRFESGLIQSRAKPADQSYIKVILTDSIPGGCSQRLASASAVWTQASGSLPRA